jgi:hypothetical protein
LTEPVGWHRLECRLGGLRYDRSNESYTDIAREVLANQNAEKSSEKMEGGLLVKLGTGEEVNIGPELVKRTQQRRNAIIKVLSDETDIRDIKDLFEEGDPRGEGIPIIGLFNPVMFAVNKPARFQYVSYPAVEEISEIFYAVYDGELLILCSECSEGRSVVGFTKVGDQVAKLISRAIERSETIPPCITHRSLFIVNGEANNENESSEVQVVISEAPTVTDALRLFYATQIDFLWKFYGVAQSAFEARKISIEMRTYQRSILELVERFVNTSDYNIPAKRKLRKEIKLAITRVLRGMAEYSTLQASVSRQMDGLREISEGNNVRMGILERTIVWKEYVEANFDFEPILSVIEHARSEMDSYGVSSSSLWAAIIGAIVGAIVTLIASEA